MATSQFYYEDIAKVCRGCLGKKGEMRPLFGTCLDTMLMTVAEIQVHHGDGLPNLMCVQCVLQVSRAFTFKKQCERSDTTLRDFLRKSTELPSIAPAPPPVSNPTQPTPIQPSADLPPQAITTDDEEQIGDIQLVDSQPVEVEFEDPSNGEKCLLIVQQMPIIEETGQEIEMPNVQIIGEVVMEEDNPDNVELDDLPDDDAVYSIDEPSDLKIEDCENAYNVDLISDDFGSFPNSSSTDPSLVVSAHDPNLYNSTEETKSIACKECGLSFDSFDSLKLHNEHVHTIANRIITNSDGGKPFKCDVCQKVFGENKVLKRHMKIHCPIKPHVCTVCNMSFAESSNLTKHKKKHTGELRNVIGKPNLCSVCGKRFKWASSLSKHMKHHTKHKILNCPYCPKYYVEARSLNIHVRSHTGEKPYVCQICTKGFTQTGNLEKHMRVHTGEKPFLCPVCGKGFSQSGYVAIHVRTHTGERPYQCSDCGKGFAGSNTLAIHKRTHTGERPYPCNICGKAFARQETAIIHQRTHTGEKPHICNVCHRGFTSSGHLSGHLRSHAGVKPHECNICKKRFAGGSSLKVHMKTHLNESLLFGCQLCNKKLPSAKALEEHELLHAVHSTTDQVVNIDPIKSNQVLITEEIIVNNSELILVEHT